MHELKRKVNMTQTQRKGMPAIDDYHAYKLCLDNDCALIHSEGEWTDRNKYRVILDSAASVNVFYNKDLIEDIWYTANPKEVTTGGYAKLFYEQMGKLTSILKHLPLPAENYYYHKNAVVNLISLGKVYKEFRVVFDLDIHDAFYIFNDDGTYVVFKKTRTNLYCLSVFDNGNQNCDVVTTTAGIDIDCSSLDQKRTETVLSLQRRIGFPDSDDLAYAIKYNLVGGYQFSRRDIQIANEIHGENTIELRDESIRSEIKRRFPERT